MFPIGDDNVHGRGPAFVTWALILINTLVFLYEISLPPDVQQEFIYLWGVVPEKIVNGVALPTLITSMFLHGGWFHLIGNMVFLWVFGDNIEAALGRIPYLLFYLLGGIVASLTHILLDSSSNIPSVGASGAIAAVLGAYLIMFPRSRIRVFVFILFRAGIIQVSALAFLGIWALTQLFSGLASLGVETAQTAGVAWWAHIGGFAAGVLTGLLFRGRANRLLPSTTP